MKISPVAQGQGVPAAEVGAASSQRTSPDRIASAKAIAAGGSAIQVSRSENNVDPQVERMQANIRKIKMRTQVSPDRNLDEIPQETTETPPISAISDDSEAQTLEETKPLSPQFAALARQKRALQVKEREIAEREKALASQAPTDGGGYSKDRIKSDPLSVLTEAGVSYDQLTDAILNQSSSDPRIQELEAKLEAVEKGFESKLSTRDEQAEETALTEMLYEAEDLAKEGETYELIRSKNAFDQVLRHIHKTYKDTGRVLDVSQAMEYIETKLLNEYEANAKIPKVLSRLTPAQETQAAPPQRQMRTLTNKDTARPVMGRRERMLAAFRGELKR